MMTNHVHIVATPLHETSLAKGIGRTHYLYTRYVNKLHGRSGHLWQNRFFSCSLEEPYFLNTVRYVERNPIRAKMVRKALRYPWSGAAVVGFGVDCLDVADCDDNNECTTDSCTASNECQYTPVQSGTACDEGLWCTAGPEACDGNGNCTGGAPRCPPGYLCDESGQQCFGAPPP